MGKNKIIVYHNTRCTKSRCALEILDKKKVDYEVVEYLKEVPSKADLKLLLARLDMKPFDLVRKDEKLFKEEYRDLKLTDSEWITVMHENPILIQRPIIIKGNKAIIGRLPEIVKDFIRS